MKQVAQIGPSSQDNLRTRHHAKTFNYLASPSAHPEREPQALTPNASPTHPATNNSAQLHKTASPLATEQAAAIRDNLKHPPAYLCRAARMATINITSRPLSKGCLTERLADDRRNAKTEKNSIQYLEEPVRLSLTSFQDQMRTLGLASISKQANNSEVPQLKLEGVPCGGKPNRNAHGKGSTPGRAVRNAVKMCTGEQSNLNEFNRILSKMHEQNEVPDDFEEPVLRTVSSRRRKTPLPSASVGRRDNPSKPETPRPHAAVSIINFAETKVVPERARCQQVYMRHFLKKGDSPQPREQHCLTQSELARELSEIKKEIAERNLMEKKASQQERFTKYTTSFIEEKLTMRKSLMRNYTFKKRNTRPQDDNYEDFDVDGWNSEADRPA